jgi:hypothetical protein
MLTLNSHKTYYIKFRNSFFRSPRPDSQRFITDFHTSQLCVDTVREMFSSRQEYATDMPATQMQSPHASCMNQAVRLRMLIPYCDTTLNANPSGKLLLFNTGSHDGARTPLLFPPTREERKSKTRKHYNYDAPSSMQFVPQLIDISEQ